MLFSDKVVKTYDQKTSAKTKINYYILSYNSHTLTLNYAKLLSLLSTVSESSCLYLFSP